MGFAENLRKRCDQAKDKAETVVRHTALSLHSSLVEKSPVDTGRFKGNWMTSVNSVNTHTTETVGLSDPSPALRAKIGDTIFITNSLPYAKRLEDGWSKQAPYGMVALTVQAFSDALGDAVRQVK